MKTQKAKKLRRRVKRGPVKSKEEALYDELLKSGTTLPVEAKQEKFIALMTLLLHGRIDRNTAKHLILLPPERLLCGPIETVFKTTAPLRHNTTIHIGAFPDQTLNRCELVGVQNKHTDFINLIQGSGRLLRYPPGSIVYLDVDKQEELPADMRKWNRHVSKVYISLSVERNSGENRRTRDKENSTDVAAIGVQGLHQIRRINANPGKKQLEKQTKRDLPPKKYRVAYGMGDVNSAPSSGYTSYKKKAGISTSAAMAALALKKSKEKLFDF